MFKSRLAITAIILFLVINTSYFWEGMFGIFAILIYLILIIIFAVLTFSVLKQLYFAIKENFKIKQRLYKICFVVLVLITVVMRPFGIINYASFESENILVSDREGVANCMTTLMLKESGRFKMRSVCFGIDEDIGTYTIQNDTVKLNYLSTRGATGRFKYAVLDSTKKYLRFYNTTPDTTPYWLYIRLNKTKLK
jgi:Ca2+/Na+ antiporter